MLDIALQREYCLDDYPHRYASSTDLDPHLSPYRGCHHRVWDYVSRV